MIGFRGNEEKNLIFFALPQKKVGTGAPISKKIFSIALK